MAGRYRGRPCRPHNDSSSEESDSNDSDYDGYDSSRGRSERQYCTQDYRGSGRDHSYQRSRHDRRQHDRREDDCPRYKGEHDTEVTASKLVEALANCPNWEETLLNLFEKEEMKPSEVRNIASKTPSVFHLDGEVLSLKPQISLCEEHMHDGCRSRNNCRRLHICDKYITGDCQSRSCVMGHKWNTNHNTNVLKKYNLNNLPYSTLDKLIYEMTLSSEPDEPLEVCLNYNKKECRDIYCKQLHLCLSLVKNKNVCQKRNCRLNHDILEHSCLKLFKTYGISVNESPRDILGNILRKNPYLINDDKSKNDTESDCDETSDSTDNLGTVWFDSPNGDVNIPEICYYSVESLCQNEAQGCDRLHSTHHFHWQISEHGDSWYNLTLPHIKCLELSYSKPEDVTLERLNPRNLNRSSRSLLLLMGRDEWQADFKTMTLSSSSQSKLLKLRRLCTQKISGNKDDQNKSSKTTKEHKTRASMVHSADDNSYSMNVSRDHIYDMNSKGIKKHNSHLSSNKQQNQAYGSSFHENYKHKKQTVLAKFPSGNVKIKEICYYSVEEKCRYEESGCKRLHATNHFLWQIKKNKEWYNLSTQQSISLECAYCDPQKDSSLLERLDLKAPEIRGSDLLNILGTDKWEANFIDMTITNVTKNGQYHYLQRLCTEYLPNRQVASNTFKWYFIDQNKKCIPYGDVDTTGRNFLKSEVTSKEIERQYCQYIQLSAKNTMVFKNAMFSYIIDFDKMTQTNMSTKVSRIVKRRPMLDKKYIKKVTIHVSSITICI